MNVPCWHVLTWKRIEVSATQFSNAVRHMRCLGISVRDDEAMPAKRRGEVVWSTNVKGHELGVAWEWGEVSDGIVAMIDPLTILSNVELVADDGSPMGSDEFILHLNSAVNRLPWQSAVRRLGASRLRGGTGRRASGALRRRQPYKAL